MVEKRVAIRSLETKNTDQCLNLGRGKLILRYLRERDASRVFLRLGVHDVFVMGTGWEVFEVFEGHLVPRTLGPGAPCATSRFPSGSGSSRGGSWSACEC